MAEKKRPPTKDDADRLVIRACKFRTKKVYDFTIVYSRMMKKHFNFRLKCIRKSNAITPSPHGFLQIRHLLSNRSVAEASGIERAI